MGNRVTELLKIEKPVLEAAMTYLSDPILGAAVCNAGGMGILGINCMVTEPEPDPVKNGENMRAAIRKIRELGGNKPFAVNYSPIPNAASFGGYNGVILDIIAEEKVPIILMCGIAENADYIAEDIEKLHGFGCTIVYRDLCPTLARCQQAVEYGADALIVTGCEAGGHITAYDMPLSSLLPQVTAAIHDVPIIAAGGIACEASARAARAMGAEGVYVGTAFQVAKECRAHAAYKQAILDAKGTDVIRWQSSVFDTRMSTLPNLQGRMCASLARGGASNDEINVLYAGKFRDAMILGDVEMGCVSVGAAVDLLTEERPAGDIVRELAKPFED